MTPSPMPPPRPSDRRHTAPLPEPDAKSRIAAGAFAVALGWAGVHRFYLGHVGIGIAQIAVTLVTFGLGWMWGVIEGVLILTRDRRFLADADGRPLRD